MDYVAYYLDLQSNESGRNLLINNVLSNAILLEYGFNFGAHIDVERDGHLMNKIGGGSITT